jgi:hypothetical protein
VAVAALEGVVRLEARPLVPRDFSAMMSKAWSQVTGANSPFLSNFPFFMRSIGFCSRSSPYMILERK